MESGESRPKRRCVQRRTNAPSATHYVGYVEDEETPEMIMRKFEELDRVIASNNPGGHQTTTTKQQNGSEQMTTNQQHSVTSEEKAAGTQLTGKQITGTHHALPMLPQPEPVCERLLLEVFKRTSYFNMSSMLEDSMYEGGVHGGVGAGMSNASDKAWSSEDVCGSDSERDQNGFWSDEGVVGGGGGGSLDIPSHERDKKARRGRSRQKLERILRPQSMAREKNMRNHVLTQYNKDTNALIRRKIKPQVQRDEVLQLRIPPAPIPVSWGRTVKPWDPLFPLSIATLQWDASEGALGASANDSRNDPDFDGSKASGCAFGSSVRQYGRSQAEAASTHPHSDSYFETVDISQFLSKKSWDYLKHPFQAVLINSGWEPSVDFPEDSKLLERFKCLPMTMLCPSGFIFVWACKQHIHPVTKQLYSWGYQYVENLTWVWIRPNHTIVSEPYPVTRKSHLTLLIFRREGEGKDIELKHQRNPDAFVDCVCSAGSREWDVPQEVYRTIETMLPTGSGRFLELWASKDQVRQGWTHIVQLPD